MGVRFTALACDYDGTLATRDRMSSETVAALEQARRAGLRLLLVTGRTFFELTRVCERLDLFDGVVAENGAVAYFPPTGLLRDRAAAPPSRLLAALDRRGVAYQAGRVIIGVGRGDEANVRAALAEVGVALELIYNRGALMLLPAGVTKGSGVRHVLRELALSPHDVLALGDAENDLALFEACGFAGCPGDAETVIRQRADWVFPGADGSAIATAIRGPILGEELEADGSPRRQLDLGWASETAEPVAIPTGGVNLLVLGDPGSGKSWLAGALVERLHEARYAVCVIDPEGDYHVLRRLPGIRGVDVEGLASVERAMGSFDRDPAACLVLDLSSLRHVDKVQAIETALVLAARLRRRLGRPHWVVLDEAHYSLHPGGVRESALDLRRGGWCLVAYKPSWLRPSALEAMDIAVLARTTASGELSVVRGFLGDGETAERVVGAVATLPPGKFVVVHRGRPGRALSFAPRPRLTAHVRHLRKYADATVAEGHEFVFRDADGHVLAAADSLSGFQDALARVSPSVLAAHAARGDFSRWVLDVLADQSLGQQIGKLEGRSRRGEAPDLAGALRQVIALRYGFPGSA